MGDRANIVFMHEKTTDVRASTAAWLHGNIVLNSHWGGESLATDLQKALLAAHRWDDPGYATRIAISQIIGNEWRNETGFGLYVGELGDNEHNVLVVDWPNKRVRSIDADTGQIISSATFADFLGFDDVQARHFHEPE